MKIKIRESNFSITASIDERIKTTKNKLVVKRPTATKLRPSDTKNKLAIKGSTLWTIRPKIGGIVLNSRKNNTIHKTSNGDGLVFNQSANNTVLKYENGAAILTQKQDSYAVYKQLKVVDMFVPDVTPASVAWTSDWNYYAPDDPTLDLIYDFGEEIVSSEEQITGINTSIQLEISWDNYDAISNVNYLNNQNSSVEWKVWVSNLPASYQTATLLPNNSSPVTITVSNNQYIVFGLAYENITLGVVQPQIRRFTVRNKTDGNAVLHTFTMGSYYISNAL